MARRTADGRLDASSDELLQEPHTGRLVVVAVVVNVYPSSGPNTLLAMSSSLVHAMQRACSSTSSLSRGGIQTRSLWQEVIRIRTDKEGKKRHEDPDRVVRRFQEQRRSDGECLLDLYFYNDKHEKSWMKRKRMDDQRRYQFDKKHVMDLAKYIQFVQKNSTK
eukprot:Nitzschia sp. Nitz4//scaffold34_size148208//81202//81690//NITZ4_002984-RA/size148208-processed-gene-0.15-mRNA-1//1//CDS//3329548807//7377//frame0